MHILLPSLETFKLIDILTSWIKCASGCRCAIWNYRLSLHFLLTLDGLH